MTFNRLPFVAGLLCVLLLGFAGASNGQTPTTGVRWDVAQSPTEVINTGRSEVTGSVTLFAHDTGAVTGTSTGGDTQIALVYDQPSMQIDNTTSTGIKLFASPRFPTGTSGTSQGLRILTVENFLLNGRCTGRVVINIPGGVTVTANDFIRLEGVRGRIDMSLAQTPGTDLFVSLQSINDPAANQFNPDRVRVAKSFDGMNVKITANSLLLCFPSSGFVAPPSEPATIRISEGFGRAFVDDDANTNNRTDDFGAPLGNPTNSTEFKIWLSAIPASVSSLTFPAVVNANEGTGAQLVLVDATYDKATQQAIAIYSYEAQDQTNLSDTRVESFDVQPTVALGSGQTATGVVLAAVTLAPVAETAPSGCVQPGSTANSALTLRPRFMQMWESNADDVIQDDTPLPIFNIIRCNCYMLFTYVTANGAFDTGISVANTTGDEEVFGDLDAPNQIGPVTFFFYDRNNGFVGSYTTTQNVAVGRSYVNVLSAILPLVKPAALTTFEGYVIARADFQFCHAFAFIADSRFATVAHGYLANIIPDPAIKNPDGVRPAADAGDPSNVPAGEGLNN